MWLQEESFTPPASDRSCTLLEFDISSIGLAYSQVSVSIVKVIDLTEELLKTAKQNVALELAWMNNMIDFAFPYLFQHHGFSKSGTCMHGCSRCLECCQQLIEEYYIVKIKFETLFGENVRYLPGIKLGENVVTDPDLESAVKDANMLVFVTPHQFIDGICKKLVGKIRQDAVAISLIKGMDLNPEGPNMVSKLIKDSLHIDCCVLMGANIANEIAKEPV